MKLEPLSAVKETPTNYYLNFETPIGGSETIAKLKTGGFPWIGMKVPAKVPEVLVGNERPC